MIYNKNEFKGTYTKEEVEELKSQLETLRKTPE
jgi:hypothetical protein